MKERLIRSQATRTASKYGKCSCAAISRHSSRRTGPWWRMIDEARFLGIHAHNNPDPDKWDAGFTLASYRDEWLRQAAESRLSNMPSLWLKAFSGQRIW